MKKLIGVIGIAGSLFITPAMALDVEHATVTSLTTGGLQGAHVGCLYVTVTNPATNKSEVYTLPYDASPNTPQLAAVNLITTHTILSFNVGAPSDDCSAAPNAFTILLPTTP